jgi:hypothetical protein
VGDLVGVFVGALVDGDLVGDLVGVFVGALVDGALVDEFVLVVEEVGDDVEEFNDSTGKAINCGCCSD